MSGLLNKVWRPLLVLLAALAFFLGAYFFFYRDSYDAPATPEIAFEQISLPSSSFTTFTEAPPTQGGMFLVDGAHSNDFTKDEIGALISRVADRGYEVEVLGEASPFGGFGSLRAGERLFLLEEKLRQADSLAVIVPQEPYPEQEVDVIEEFVRKGGKLLLIADPTRNHQINSLAERFGISFRPDYLYNMVDNDLNFQNIFITEGHFRTDELTKGLRRVALYTAGSIESSGTRLAVTDENTRSSMVERIEPFYPLVKGADGRVLGISDLTFMIPPQNGILDNDTLVSNIADYLTTSQREFELADFPHFFRDEVDILLGGASIFDVGTELKNTFSDFLIQSEVRGIEDLTTDTVFLGLYEESAAVAQYLDVAGVQVDDTLRTPFTPDIDTSGTAIILLHRTQERHVLVILGSSRRSLDDIVRRLGSGQFEFGLVSDFLGVYRTF